MDGIDVRFHQRATSHQLFFKIQQSNWQCLVDIIIIIIIYWMLWSFSKRTPGKAYPSSNHRRSDQSTAQSKLFLCLSPTTFIIIISNTNTAHNYIFSLFHLKLTTILLCKKTFKRPIFYFLKPLIKVQMSFSFII